MRAGHLYKWLLLFLVVSAFAQPDDNKELETENDEKNNSSITFSNDDSAVSAFAQPDDNKELETENYEENNSSIIFSTDDSVVSAFAQPDDNKELETENYEKNNSSITFSNDDSDLDDPTSTTLTTSTTSTTVISSVRPRKRYKPKFILKRGPTKSKLVPFRARAGKIARTNGENKCPSLVRGSPVTPHGSGCHGSIIENENLEAFRYFLTTASCVNIFHDLDVKIGDDLEPKKFAKYKIVRLMPYETYGEGKTRDDIAVVKLSKEIRRNSLAQPIKLSSRIPDLNEKCKVYSWKENLEPDSFINETVVTITACKPHQQSKNNFCFRTDSGLLCKVVRTPSNTKGIQQRYGILAFPATSSVKKWGLAILSTIRGPIDCFGCPVVCDGLLSGMFAGLYIGKDPNCAYNAFGIGVAGYVKDIGEMMANLDKLVEVNETIDEIQTDAPDIDDGAASITGRQFMLMLFLLIRL